MRKRAELWHVQAVALLTPLSLTDAQSLCKCFGLDVREIEALEAGTVNSNFIVTDTSNRRYFARLYEEQGLSGAISEHVLLAELQAAGLPVLVPLSCRELPMYRGKPFAVFPFVDGEILCQARITPRVCRKVGAVLAQIHLCTPKLSKFHEGRFELPDLERRLDRIEREARPELVEAARGIRAADRRYAPMRDVSLAHGVLHGDLFRDNVLWQGDEIAAVIDFESAALGAFAFDLAVTVLAWCYSDQFELELVRALLRGYHEKRPLSAKEQAAFPVETIIGCIRFATTRITDCSMRIGPGEKPARDYRRFLARLRDIEQGALDDLKRPWTWLHK